MNLEAVIRVALLEQAAKCGGSLRAEALDRSTVLADTGLDSLGFTSLVIDLERKLDVDPFSDDNDIMYPETFGELTDLYRAAATSHG